ncbi:MAG TPA: ATP-binding protein [Verrucomicrobiae bacterium]|nr:ATP-binding protein [Verrucomicrobiae bacterium]
MLHIYYYLVLANSVVALSVAVTVFLKNRYDLVGPTLSAAMVILAVWLMCFAQYFRPMPFRSALLWAHLTLSCAIVLQPVLLHSLCALCEKIRQMKWWVVASYASALLALWFVWWGHAITGLKHAPFMDHYVSYKPVLGGHLVFWQVLGAGVLIHSAGRAVGYKHTQLVYFTVAWLITFLTAHLTILPLEYNINIQPLGFFVLPLNLGMLAYAVGKARLADYNVVIARVLLYAITMVVTAGIALFFLGGLAMFAPGFMNQEQLFFAFALSMAIGTGLTFGLPRFLPRAERMMQERMFGKRYGYQDALSGLVRELSVLPTIDEVLGTVATTLHTQMHLSRALLLLQDPLSGDYKVKAESGLGPDEDVETLTLLEDSAVIKWLQINRDELVRDEMVRRVGHREREHLEAEMNLLRVVLCVPMILDGRLVGLVGLGEKLNHDMFFVSDLRLLETLATEVALAVKYRHIEDEVFRKNRLIELGTIAAGVAHEIRNPLASIKTFAQLMPERIDDPEFRNEFGRLVLKDVDRITKVIESMLAFARPSQVNIKEQPANELVEEAILLVQPRFKAKHIELTRAFHGNPVVKVDKHQILQVLVNLLSNAADALHEQGKIRVATGLTQMDISVGGNGNRNFAVIEVSDNGPGIPTAVRSRLFDPFFTTKKEGTGLGLSISQKIVRDHGGAITVSSVEGKGTTFQVNLPVK